MNDAGPKKWTPGRVIAWVVGIVLIIAGLLTVGFFVLMSVAMASYGSNK